MNKMFHTIKTLTILLFVVNIVVNSFVANATSQALLPLKIKAEFIELHSGPGVGYPVLHVIEKGEFVSVLFKRTSWLKVKDQRGNEGWLNEKQVFGLSDIGLSNNGDMLAQTEFSLTDFQTRNYEAGIMYGDFDGADFYNIYLDFVFSDVFSGEISAGKALGDISDSDIYEVMLISQPLPELIISPYVAVGAGIINTRPHSVLADSQTRQNSLMSVAFGVKYHLARNFVLRAEYKYSLVLTDRDDNEEIQVWKLGFSVFF